MSQDTVHDPYVSFHSFSKTEGLRVKPPHKTLENTRDLRGPLEQVYVLD